MRYNMLQAVPADVFALERQISFNMRMRKAPKILSLGQRTGQEAADRRFVLFDRSTRQPTQFREILSISMAQLDERNIDRWYRQSPSRRQKALISTLRSPEQNQAPSGIVIRTECHLQLCNGVGRAWLRSHHPFEGMLELEQIAAGTTT
jgi:hypothetical protein